MKTKRITILSIFAVLFLSIATIIIINKSVFDKNIFGEPNNIIPNGHERQLLSSGKNHKIYDLTKNHNSEYLYEIYNSSGKVIKSETVTRSSPTINYLSSSLLSIENGTGSYSWLAQYYDIDKNIFSDIFDSPLAVQEDKIVYLDNNFKLIVSNIFDKTKYYREFRIKLSPSAIPVSLIKKVAFINKNQLEVSFLSGKTYKEKTIMLQLD